MKTTGDRIITLSALILTLAITNVQAQNDNPDIYAGGGLSYGEKLSELGLQLNGYYIYNEDFRFGGDLVYWLLDSPPGGSVNYLEFNGNAHYLFYDEEDFSFYGIGSLGLHRMSTSADTQFGTMSYSDTDLALGFGAGGEYNMAPLRLFAEARFFLTGLDQLGLSFGVRYGI